MEKVIVKPRTTSIQNDHFIFEDNSEVQVNNVIWSTGFISDFTWIDIAEVFDESNLAPSKKRDHFGEGVILFGIAVGNLEGGRTSSKKELVQMQNIC